jgi:hypothetical protein
MKPLALIEVYDSRGRCFAKWNAPDPMTALADLGLRCMDWKGLGFKNASCYTNHAMDWNVEIKD